MRASSTARKATISAEIGLNVGLVLALFLWLPGCATPPTDPDARAAFEEANDPLEPTNRAIFDVNVALDDHIVKPVAEAYRVVPEDLRKGMHNMIVTVHAPVLFGNYLMQADPDSTADTVLRFLINITAGVGGFFDVASMVGVPTHDTDFGVTLAKWGVGEGFYLMLPGFGPSNPRDAIGLGVNSLMDPIGYFATLLESFGRLVYEGIDKREPLIEPLDEIRRTSVDYYATLRSLYRQRREDQIRSGKGGANFPAPSISGPGDMPNTAPEAARPVEPPTSSANIASVAGQSQAGAELPGAADSAAGLGGNETVPAGPSEQSALANEARDPTGRPNVER